MLSRRVNSWRKSADHPPAAGDAYPHLNKTVEAAGGSGTKIDDYGAAV
jgi:hypothetical protein